MPTDFAKLRQEIDELIVRGQLEQARRRLARLSRRRFPREEIRQYVMLARRAQLPNLAIRLLNPIVHPSRKGPAVALADEKAEYAASLIRIGAPEEALELLRTIDAEKSPEVLLFQSFALVANWDYAAALPLLGTYLESPSLSEYQRYVGKANLAAALTAEGEFAKADQVLAELRRASRDEKYGLLRRATMELSARNAISKKDKAEANRFLEELGRTQKDYDPSDFLAFKWRCFLDLQASPGRAAWARLEELRRKARERQDWETLRECDRFELVIKKTPTLFARLYFGTESSAYRRKLLGIAGLSPVPERYEWRLGEPPRQVLDLITGTIRDKPQLRPGYIVHRLLVALSSDFYRPLRVAAIHYRLYPEDFFNPNSSINRVYQAINRFRKWNQKQRLPFLVQEKRENYRLAARWPCAILIRQKEVLGQQTSFQEIRLRERLGVAAFSAKQAMEALCVSQPTVSRVLRTLESRGVLERTGEGPATRYRFPSQGRSG